MFNSTDIIVQMMRHRNVYACLSPDHAHSLAVTSMVEHMQPAHICHKAGIHRESQRTASSTNLSGTACFQLMHPQHGRARVYSSRAAPHLTKLARAYLELSHESIFLTDCCNLVDTRVEREVAKPSIILWTRSRLLAVCCAVPLHCSNFCFLPTATLTVRSAAMHRFRSTVVQFAGSDDLCK